MAKLGIAKYREDYRQSLDWAKPFYLVTRTRPSSARCNVVQYGVSSRDVDRE
jgi:hypothetical protein